MEILASQRGVEKELEREREKNKEKKKAVGLFFVVCVFFVPRARDMMSCRYREGMGKRWLFYLFSCVLHDGV